MTQPGTSARSGRASADRTGGLCQGLDITAAHTHALPALHRAAVQGLATLADPGYEGNGYWHPHPGAPGKSDTLLGGWAWVPGG
jgi:hypothetical protein